MMDFDARIQENPVSNGGAILDHRIIQKDTAPAHFGKGTDVNARADDTGEVIAKRLGFFIDCLSELVIANYHQQMGEILSKSFYVGNMSHHRCAADDIRVLC